MTRWSNCKSKVVNMESAQRGERRERYSDNPLGSTILLRKKKSSIRCVW